MRGPQARLASSALGGAGRAWRLPRAYGKLPQQRVHAICLNGPCAFPAAPLFLRRAFSGLSGFGTSRSPRPGNWFPTCKMGARQAPVLFFGFSETPPAVPGRVKGLSLSVPSEAGRYSISKSCSTQREEPCLLETGQMMQKTEHSVPFERLAGQYAFPKLTQASGFAGGPTARPGAQGKMSVSPHGAVFSKGGTGPF